MSSEDIKSLTNEDLATILRNSGVRVGPITDTTRLVYERKLARLQKDAPPATAPAEEFEEEEEEEDEEEIIAGSVYEEKTTERSYDMSTKLPRSVTRRSRRGASPPPPDISLDESQGGRVTRKGSQKKKGKTPKKLPPEVEEPFRPLPAPVPEEKVMKPPKNLIKNVVEMKPPEEPKPLPKSKLKSNIPRVSSRRDYANSTVISPEINFRARTTRRSFGLSDSFHINPATSPKSDAIPYSEKEYIDEQNFVTAGKEIIEVNEADSDASVDSLQDNDDEDDDQFTDNPRDHDYDNYPVDSYANIKNSPKTSVEYLPVRNFNYGQETNSSEMVYNVYAPTKATEIFKSQIPSKYSAKSQLDDQENLHVFKKPSIPARRLGQPRSSDSPLSQKKSNSIWQLDPVEEQNIQRGLGELHTGSTDSSDKYDYLPKAFVEKYGKYMNKSGVDRMQNRRSIDSVLFQTHREQAKSSNSDSVSRVKPEKLTSAYQRYASPLASKISAANNAPPSYIGTPGVGTPGSSRLNTTLNTSLTRRPLREEVQFTSLRNSQGASSASAAPKKKGMSIMWKLLILIVLGLIAWLIYINFESPAPKPLITTNH